MINVKKPSNVTIDFPYKECEGCNVCKAFVQKEESSEFYGLPEYYVSCKNAYICKRWYDIVSTLLSEVKDE